MSGKRNILLIMTDQQRYDILSACGGGACRVPALEKLAGEGISFDNAYSVCAVCTPARASVFTGRFPHKHGMTRNCDMFHPPREDLPDSEILLNHYLAEKKYNCGYVGKWHIDKTKSALDHGFEGFSLPGYGDSYGNSTQAYLDWLEAKGMSSPRFIPTVMVGENGFAGYLDAPLEATYDYFLAEKAIDMLRKYAEYPAPFFLTLQFWGPHEICRPVKSYLDIYPPEDIPMPGNFSDSLEDKPYVYKQYRDVLEFRYPGLSKLSESDWRRINASYYAYNSMIDHLTGKVLDELKRLESDKNTTVIFTSDHGSYCAAHGGFIDKSIGMFEDIYKIPFIVRAPGNNPGRRSQMISNMDVFSTVLGQAGIELPENVDSRDVSPLLENDAAAWDDAIFCQSHGVHFPYAQRMLRWKDFKYVFTPTDVDELYDLKKDPDETKNLIEDIEYGEIKRILRSKMLVCAEKSSDPIQNIMEPYFKI